MRSAERIGRTIATRVTGILSRTIGLARRQKHICVYTDEQVGFLFSIGHSGSPTMTRVHFAHSWLKIMHPGIAGSRLWGDARYWQSLHGIRFVENVEE